MLEACSRRNHVPTVHSYPDHYFITMHTPLLGTAGHVHLLELDQIIGERFLVTVHGPLNPAVDPAEALVETEGVLQRIREGRFRPESPGRGVVRAQLRGGARGSATSSATSPSGCPAWSSR